MIEKIKRFLRSGYNFGDSSDPEADAKQIYEEYMDVAWPATAQGLFLEVVMVISLAMVGVLGAKALAAIAIMGQPRMVMLLFARSISIAVTALVARRRGQKDRLGMNAVLNQSLLLSFLFYIPFLSLFYVCLEDILLLVGAQEEIMNDAIAFGQYVTISILFATFSQLVGGALIGVGNTRIIFYSNAIGNVVMIALNVFLIYGLWGAPQMGVAGAGLGTLVGNAVTAILLGFVVWGKGKEISLNSGVSWGFTKEVLAPLGKIGLSSFGEQAFERFGMVMYTIMVTSLGVVALATHHVCMALCNIFYALATGLGQATTARVGQSLGQKRPDIAEAFCFVGVRVGLLISGIGCLIFFLGREPIMLMYTRDIEVVELGSQIMYFVALANIPQCLQLVYSGVLKGAGDNYYVMKYSLIVIAIFRPLLTYFLCFVAGWGLYGAWFSLLCDQSLRMLCAKIRVTRGRWKAIEI